MGATDTLYFDAAGPANTEATLLAARARAEALGVRHVVVATTSGATGVLAADIFANLDLVVVSHVVGFGRPNTSELQPELKAQIEASGARVLTTGHAMGGIGRAIRRKFGTLEVDELVAHVLRLFGQGTKVACEIVMMASDAGLVPAGAEVVAVGGSDSGADTALVVVAANSTDLFDLHVAEVICKPRRWE
jgi:uncharacterized protein